TCALREVLDEDRLPESVRELLAENTSDDVGTAARRGANDEADRPRRPVLRRDPHRRDGRGPGQGEQSSSRQMHQNLDYLSSASCEADARAKSAMANAAHVR